MTCECPKCGRPVRHVMTEPEWSFACWCGYRFTVTDEKPKRKKRVRKKS